MADAVNSISAPSGLQADLFRATPSCSQSTLVPEGRLSHPLWEEINALGGIPSGSEYDRGYCDAISRVLETIEGLVSSATLSDTGEI